MNKHEQQICDYFLRNDYISAVLQPVKSGKEASVFLCRGSELYQNRLLCLKVYKDFSQRSFKHTAVYQDGRFDGMGGKSRRGIRFKSSWGKSITEEIWIASEMDALARLHEAGVNVPFPYEMSANAILMEYIGDQHQIANQLKDEKLFELKTRYLFKKIISNIQQMYNLNIVHGDLSAYNILVWKNRPVIIDFPQFVNPERNSNGYGLLHRDVDNICNFFAKKGIEADSLVITDKICEYEKVNI